MQIAQSLQADVAQPSRRRFRVMGLLFVTIVINYLDRSNISIAAPTLTSEFHLDPVQLGLVFSAFGWTYTTFQLPGGWKSQTLKSHVPPPNGEPVVQLTWAHPTAVVVAHTICV